MMWVLVLPPTYDQSSDQDRFRAETVCHPHHTSMPKRRYRRKKSCSRPRRRRRTRKKRRVRTGFPSRMAVSLPYSEIDLDIAAPANLAGSYFFRANDLFDPNQSGTGHQPRGFDQYMNFYKHFVVIGSRISVTFQNNSDFPIRCGIMLRDAAVGHNFDPDDCGEYPKKRERGCDGVTQGGRSTVTISLGCSPRKFLGRSKVLSDNQLKGDAGNSPAEVVYYQIYVYALDGTSSVPQTHIRVTIKYAAVFIEPAFGAPS